MTIMVGRKAPDFTAPAYHKGSFTPVSLSSFLGKWVVVCFYPGDFLHSSERPRYRRSPINTRNFRLSGPK